MGKTRFLLQVNVAKILIGEANLALHIAATEPPAPLEKETLRAIREAMTKLEAHVNKFHEECEKRELDRQAPAQITALVEAVKE